MSLIFSHCFLFHLCPISIAVETVLTHLKASLAATSDCFVNFAFECFQNLVVIASVKVVSNLPGCEETRCKGSHQFLWGLFHLNQWQQFLEQTKGQCRPKARLSSSSEHFLTHEATHQSCDDHLYLCVPLHHHQPLCNLPAPLLQQSHSRLGCWQTSQILSCTATAWMCRTCYLSCSLKTRSDCFDEKRL